MVKSKYSALGLPKYLFQEQSKTSPQISPDATFNPASAIGGSGGFVLQTAPNQQPKKKEIYLDYNSILRLKKPADVALAIAKLKEEGFEVAFIQNLENNNIFKSKIDDSKFKDKKGNSQNVFSLSDDFIKQNFSAQIHETSAKKLNLASDDSIILNYDQFKEISEILTQEHWVDEKKRDVISPLALSFLDVSVEKVNSQSYEKIVNSVYNNRIVPGYTIQNLVDHKNFDITNSATIEVFNFGLQRLNIDNLNYEFVKYNFFESLDEKKLGDLFDASRLLAIEQEKIILLQKNILKQLWFKHSDFKKGVMDRVRTLDEFKDKSAYEIATSFFGDSIIENSARALSTNYSLDISERYPEAGLEVFKFLGTHQGLSVITKQQKEKTAFGQKFEVSFTLLSNESKDTQDFIELRVSSPLQRQKYEQSLSLELFIMKFFLNSEINQHFDLTEQFSDALIAKSKEQTAFEAFKSYYPKIFEHLNEDQRKRFLDDLLKKASSLDIDKIIETTGGYRSIFMPTISFAQNNLDKPGMKDLAETMLIKLTEYIGKENEMLKPFFRKKAFPQKLIFENLTPEFQDFLIEMDKDRKIKLDEIPFHTGEEIYAKINIALSWDKSKVSSQKIPTSPLQINLFDLNNETLEKIKEEIKNKDLDASKILSLKIFGIEREKTNKAEGEVKLLFESLVALFPDLKHVRVNTEGIKAYASDLQGLIRMPEKPVTAFDYLDRFAKEKGVVLEKYNSSDLKNTIEENNKEPESQTQFTATKRGDKIYMGDAKGNRAKDNDVKATFLMEEAGEIISRPDSLKPFITRDSSNQINPNFSKLEDDLLVEINKPSSSINLKNCQKNKESFEEKRRLLKTTSPDKTICSFTRNLKRNNKTTLPSISPDNEIIAYYTEPLEANITFFKDEKSGFYCAQSDKSCQIHYIIEGRELESKIPTDDLSALPKKVQDIIDQYLPDKNPFLLSVLDNQYTLPDFENKDKNRFLNELFDIENKGSCRHRVAALAHRFTQEKLNYGEDFRIIGTDGNHVLLELKKEDGNWSAHDLGGSEAELIEKKTKTDNNFLALPDGFKKSSSLLAPLAICTAVILAPVGALYGISSLCRKASSSDPKEEQSVVTTLSIPPSPHNSFSETSLQQTPLPNASLDFTSASQTPSPTASSPQLLSKTALLIESELKKLNQLTKIDTLTAFEKEFKESVKTKKSSLFLKTTRGEDLGEELKNYLLKIGNSLQDSGASVFGSQSSEPSFETFCIPSPQDLTIKKPTLGISKDISQGPSQDARIAKITNITPLFSFLENAKTKSDKQHVLIIDWGKFDASSQVAFNTMFDKNDRKIDDKEIPDNVTIVCIDSSKKNNTDSSILSRFDKSFNLSSIGKNQYKNSSSGNSSQDKNIIEIDGEGFVNWREKLFGRVELKGAIMEWQKSDFVKNLEQQSEQPFQLNFKNFSSEQQKEMKLFFDQGKSSGSINYNDYKIKIPSDLIVQFEKKEFEFTEVLESFKTQDSPDSPASLQSPSTLKIYQDIQASAKLPLDIHLINSYLFDKLLAQPKIEDNQYQEELGLIEQASKSDSKTLKLFLSENLSNQQLYCLLNQANQHQVSLELYLAKDVKMPDKSFEAFTQEQPKQEITAPAQTSDSGMQPTSRIIITNDIEESLKEFKQEKSPEKTLNLVNIEDVLYGDLFEKNQHELVSKADGAKHFSFEKIESDIKTKLDEGKIVVLKGQFSDELLSILHPQILDMQQKFSNLHFIIEDKNILESKPESTKLSWLDSSLYQVKHVAKTAEQTKNPKIEKEQFDCVGEEIPENSSQEAQKFIAKRKETLQKLLRDNSALQIFGHSGVGKSSLFREIKKDGVEVYDELSSFEKWANNKEEGKPKILVIDEFNVDGSTNFTTFRDLANNPNSSQQIFHQGKFYNLDENHKVVFLGNPKSYGNRFEQKLFSDCNVAELHLNDFPTSYIYENILKEPIFKGLSDSVKALLEGEKVFKEIATKEIKSYKQANRTEEIKVYNELEHDDLPKETVRELQEKVLKEIAKKIPKTGLEDVQNHNFIATQANQESIEQLQSAIQIRQLQKSGEFPPQSLGTCGVIFKGDSGVGKSVMIEAVLENRGITKVDSLEDLEKTLNKEKSLQQETEITPETKPHYYYKIPASLPIEEIKKNLIKAFELGVITVFDEMNTRIKEGGLEKDINALLTGQHPTDSKIKPKEGFMIIASVNQATNAGRSKFSSAIEHRCNMISAKPLSEYQKEDFEKIITNWIDNDKDKLLPKVAESTIQKIAKSFQELLCKNPSACNLRDLKKALPNILKDLTSQKITGSGYLRV